MVFEQFNLVVTGHANGELQVRTTWTRTIMMAPEISWLKMVKSSCYKCYYDKLTIVPRYHPPYLSADTHVSYTHSRL